MTWQLDPAHTEINFSVRHMMISKVRGSFESFSGAVNFNPEDLAQGSIEVSIDATSINTRNEQRDGHLKSADFLDAETYPNIIFKSTGATLNGADSGQLIGDLTIRDVTKPVTMDVEYAGSAKSPWGLTSAGFSATTKINRKDWGLEWNQALETGGVLVGEELTISIEAELIDQPDG
jgi:polyisoprenoid-binding protein YceI